MCLIQILSVALTALGSDLTAAHPAFGCLAGVPSHRDTERVDKIARGPHGPNASRT